MPSILQAFLISYPTCLQSPAKLGARSKSRFSITSTSTASTTSDIPDDPSQLIQDLQSRLKQAEARLAEIETSEADELRLAKDQRLVDLEAEVAMANAKVVELEAKLRAVTQVEEDPWPL